MWLRLFIAFVFLVHGLAGSSSVAEQRNVVGEVVSVTQSWTASAISNCDDAITTTTLVVVQQVPVAIRIPVPGEKQFSDIFSQNNSAGTVCLACSRSFIANLSGTLARLYIANRVLLI